MEPQKNHVTASVNIQKNDDTVGLVLELPQNFMQLAVHAQAEEPESMKEAEYVVIMDAICHVEFAKAAMQKLTKPKWTSVLRSLERLRSLPSVLGILRSLLSLQGLWAVMNVTRFQFLIEMATKHSEAVCSYLHAVFDRWNTVLQPVKHLKAASDPKSVEALAGLWPASNLRDREQLDKLFLRHDFFPSIKHPQNRAALRQELLSLDGRVLTFATLSTELRLLNEAAKCEVLPDMDRLGKSQAFDPEYWKEWVARFAALCRKVPKGSSDRKEKKSRNVYQSKDVFFTTCRWCHDTSLRQGIWRFQGDLTPFFAAPATQSPDIPDPRDLPLQGLIFDFLRCFFTAREQQTGLK
jgi:hypothetical protein